MTTKVDKTVCRKTQGIAESGNNCLTTPGTCESCPDWTKESGALLKITILGEPISKTRPRFARRDSWSSGKETVRAYSDQADKQKQFQWYIRCLAPKAKMQPKGVILAIELVFNTTSKLVDIDNLVKFVLDAGNGFLWEDDRQIEKLVARLNRVDRDPSIEIVLHRSA